MEAIRSKNTRHYDRFRNDHLFGVEQRDDVYGSEDQACSFRSPGGRGGGAVLSRISQTRGKNTELAIAKELGAKRNHFEVEDLSHPILSIEVKHRKAEAAAAP